MDARTHHRLLDRVEGLHDHPLLLLGQDLFRDRKEDPAEERAAALMLVEHDAQRAPFPRNAVPLQRRKEVLLLSPKVHFIARAA